MRGADAPFLRIEVVGAITEVFNKTESALAMGDDYHATRCAGWQRNRFAAKIGYGLGKIHLTFRECALAQCSAKRYGVLRDYVFAFQYCQWHSGVNHAQMVD